ncbi:MAG: cation:proton antiporter [Candidatus Aenigmatarchaeota archaeon]|nr:MAG: cation:proton antiporter [Candidatus Aenigmarchaeota archaeon]
MFWPVFWIFGFAAFLSLARAARGPSFADRFLGVSSFVNILTLAVVAYSVSIGTEFYIDMAIVLVMMSFVGTLAIAKWSPRRSG